VLKFHYTECVLSAEVHVSFCTQVYIRNTLLLEVFLNVTDLVPVQAAKSL